MAEKKTFVNLKQKDGGKGPKIQRKFEIGQANKLLSLSKSQWELNDENFKWNGSEIANAPKKA